MKRIILFFWLALLTTLTAYAYDFYSDGIYYNKNSDGTSVSVTYKDENYNSYSGSVVIPSSITYEGTTYSVISIGISAFKACSSLTSVNIPNSVTSIDGYSFVNCSGLTSITIPDFVTSIGDGAFINCSGLTSVTIPNSVTSIGKYAFTSCDGLTSVIIPNFVTSISEGVFSLCQGLTSVTIPNSVTSIDSYAFFSCNKMVSITIPNSVTSIGEGAFSDCWGLTSVTIPNSVTSIGQQAFEDCRGLTSVRLEDGASELELYSNNFNSYPFKNCNIENIYIGRNLSSWKALCLSSNLKNVEIGNNVLSIESSAFSGCNNLSSVKIGNSVSEIGAYAFRDCSNLFSVSIPQSVKSIGRSAFANCGKNLIIDLSKNEATIYADSFSGIKTLLVGDKVTVNGSSNSGSNVLVWLPNSTPAIKGKATYSASTHNYLSSYFKEDGFTYIPLSPSNRTCILIDCDNISEEKEIILPSEVVHNGITFKVEQLGNYALARQNEITNVVFRDCDQAIPDGFMQSCVNIREFTIPSTVQTVGEYAFSDCTGLVSLTIPNTVNSIGNGAFSKCESLASIEIPASLSTINEETFSWCSGLTSISIPNTVSSIGSYAFLNCSGLTSVVIPNTIPSLSEGIFTGCSSLSSIVIPTSIIDIGNSAFWGCTGLKAVTIPNTVSAIGRDAFNNCEALTDVAFEDGENSINIQPSAFGNGLENLRLGRNISGDWTFANITTLKSVWITDMLNSIKDGLFQGCSGLETVYIGDNVTSIGNRAFSGCAALKLFQVGKNVTSIGENALSDCSGIKDIYAEPQTPPTVATQALDDLDRWSCTLHVPAAALDAYRNADQWKEFFFYDSNFAISLSHESIILSPNQTFQLTAYLGESQTEGDSEATSPNVRWISTNPEIAVVDQTGLVRSVHSGECSIVAFNEDNVMANCRVYVSQETVITLDTESLELLEGETHQFTANVNVKTLNWASSNPEVALVDANGLLTAISPGSATITATSGDVSATCEVTVNPVDNPGGYAISIEKNMIASSGVTRIPVCLTNKKGVSSFQCDVHLPDGLALATDEDGDYDITKAERLDDSFVIATSDLNGAVRILGYSSVNNDIEGNDGAIFYLPVTVTDGAASAGKQYEITIDGISLSILSEYREVFPTDVHHTFTVFTLGDVNNDGRISALDISMVISYALGANPETGNSEAADINRDGNVSAVDVSMMVSLVLKGATPAAAKSQAVAPLTADAESVDARMADGGRLVVEIPNIARYIGAQMDIALPEGVEIKSARLAGSNADTHVLACGRLDDGMTRLLVYSPANVNFDDSDSLVELELTKTGAVKGSGFSVNNVLLVNRDGDRFNEVRAFDLFANLDVTGIDGLDPSDSRIVVNGVAYDIRPNADGKYVVADLQGRVYEVTDGNVVLLPGVYLINSQKVLVK